jgi:hypothetical protein
MVKAIRKIATIVGDFESYFEESAVFIRLIVKVLNLMIVLD